MITFMVIYFYDLACSSIVLEGHTYIHRLGPSCIRHKRCQNTLTLPTK